MKIVTTAFVQHNHTARFTLCVPCIDAKLAATILGVYGCPSRIPCTPDVDPNAAMDIRAAVARLTERDTSRQDLSVCDGAVYGSDAPSPLL